MPDCIYAKKESASQPLTDKRLMWSTGGHCAVHKLEGFVLHNDFMSLRRNFDLVWISQVNDLQNFCFGSGENDRMPR